MLAPALVAAATLAARHWGARAGGVVSAVPAIVAPVLLVAVLADGEAVTARAATGTLLGLTALSAFVLVYAHAAQRAGWRASLAVAWAAAAVVALAAGEVGAGTGASLAAAVASLLVAYALLPRAGVVAAAAVVPRWDLPVRMALTALLVVTLSAATAWLGPLTGGILAALPVLASILAVSTHRQLGPAAVAELLGGMVAGMAGFVTFCAGVAVLVEPAGAVTAFTAAAMTGTVLQLVSATRLRIRRLQPISQPAP